MKNTLYIAAVSTLVVCTQSVYSQNIPDSLFLNKTDVRTGNIKEIGTFEVKYQAVGEDFVRSLPLNLIQKIRFKNGKTDLISPYLNNPLPASGLDWEKVKLTTIGNEILGLQKLDLVNGKAKGTTSLSDAAQVKSRAYNKLLMVTAMVGGDAVLLYSQTTSSSDFLRTGASAETYLYGVAYTAKKFNLQDFLKVVGESKTYNHVEDLVLGNSFFTMDRRSLKSLQEQASGQSKTGNSLSGRSFGSTNYGNTTVPWQAEVTVSKPVIQDDGFIYVTATILDIDGSIFRVISYSESGMVLYAPGEKNFTNIVLSAK